MSTETKFKVGDEVAVLRGDGTLYSFSTVKSVRTFVYASHAILTTGDKYDARGGHSTRGGFRPMRIEIATDAHRAEAARQRLASDVVHAFERDEGKLRAALTADECRTILAIVLRANGGPS